MINLLGLIEMYNTYDHKSIFHSVASCLVKNYILLDTMTSAEIADLCNVSISTLNRFFKMMAYPMTVSRLPDLVSSTKENYTFDGSYIPLALQSSRECSIDYYINRLQSRIKTLHDSINKGEINQLAKVISSSKKVIFLGKIPKAAWRFQMDLILRGIETSAFMDPNYQYEELDKLENETVIFYTHSHKFIDNKFKQGIISGKDKVKKFVLITNNDMHPLSSLADYLFYYEGDGTEQDNILMNLYINLIAITYCKIARPD